MVPEISTPPSGSCGAAIAKDDSPQTLARRPPCRRPRLQNSEDDCDSPPYLKKAKPIAGSASQKDIQYLSTEGVISAPALLCPLASYKLQYLAIVESRTEHLLEVINSRDDVLGTLMRRYFLCPLEVLKNVQEAVRDMMILSSMVYHRLSHSRCSMRLVSTEEEGYNSCYHFSGQGCGSRV
ncbi:hypothetical protein HID58_014794 [Brassica napus]|uniref:Uncharacterized protein n=1 Tax=Brassica napus TaxID=3708 RepID=A0ABQ8DI56_BRANA|nr:hypothetical protein HID58_014794 [Brassica napus]